MLELDKLKKLCLFINNCNQNLYVSVSHHDHELFEIRFTSTKDILTIATPAAARQIARCELHIDFNKPQAEWRMFKVTSRNPETGDVQRIAVPITTEMIEYVAERLTQIANTAAQGIYRQSKSYRQFIESKGKCELAKQLASV